MFYRIRSISIHIYHKIFIAADVMILTDPFESFQDVSLTKGKFEIDPAHYVSVPQMACDAMLKKMVIVLDLISDPECTA